MLDRAHFMEGYFPQTMPREKFDLANVMGVIDSIDDAPDFLAGLLDAISVSAAISFPTTHWVPFPPVQTSL